MKKSMLLGLGVLFVGLQASAAPVGIDRGMWGAYIAGGTSCNNHNVGVIQNGNSLSILFDEFGVYMPERSFGEGASVRKTCNFRITMTPPNGFYLAGFRQVYSGGLIKSARSSARLDIRYNVGSVVGQPLPIIWSEGMAIRPEDSASTFTRTYHNNLAVANCGGSTIYGINMTMTATRRNTSTEFVVGGLDTVDADFIQRLELIPEWRLCR
jgi:hypothetical protein